MTAAELRSILEGYGQRIAAVERRIDVVQADRAELCALVASIDRKVRELVERAAAAGDVLPLDEGRGAT